MPDKGTVTLTEEKVGSVKKIKFTVTAGIDADAGLATKTTVEYYDGKILCLGTVPGVAPDVPDADWDVTVADEDGVDVLSGAGLNRSATLTQSVAEASLGAVASDKLSVSCSGLGSGKKCVVLIYVR